MYVLAVVKNILTKKSCFFSNQPARFFTTAKTYKFNNIEDINIQDFKLQSVNDQTYTYTYDAFKVITAYPKPLAKNDLTISDGLSFADMLKKQK